MRTSAGQRPTDGAEDHAAGNGTHRETALDGQRKVSQGLVGSADVAAGERNQTNFETKGGVNGEKSVLLLPDDRQEDRAACDAV